MFTLTIEPRFAETDALGHISNTTFPIWFETARDPVFKIFHPTMTTHDWPLILAKQEIDFIAQTYMDKPVTINTYVNQIGNASFDIIHEARQNDKTVARGKAVMVRFNYQTEQSEPISDSARKTLSEHLYENTNSDHDN